MRIFFIAGDDKGSGYYRMKLPAKYLNGIHESFYALSPFGTSKEYEKANIAVYQRQHEGGNGSLLNRFRKEQADGKKIIYELDDNLWHIPYNCNHFISYWTPERVKSAGALISASNKVVTSTEVLAEDVKRFNKNVSIRPNFIEMPASANNGDSPANNGDSPPTPFVIPSGVEESHQLNMRPFDFAQGDTTSPGDSPESTPFLGIPRTAVILGQSPLIQSPSPVEDKPIRIGWAGCPSHKSDFDSSVIQALKDIKMRYKDRVELIFLGWMPQDLLGITTFYRYIEPDGYINFLKNSNLDIGIIPCQLNRFNDSRSNLKFLEFSAVGAVSIASPVYPYKNTIRDDIGFIVKKNRYKEWHKTISMLIEDENLRKNISQNAYNFIKDNYQIKNKIGILEETYIF